MVRQGADFMKVVASLLTTALMMMMISGSADAGDALVYKTVDAQGNIVYTDKPASRNAPKTSLQVHEPSPADLARLEEQRQATQAAEVQRLQYALTNSTNQAQQAQRQKDKQAHCQNARNQFYALKDATRIYQRDAQGNRVYLPDAAADAKRAEAQKAMDVACTT